MKTLRIVLSSLLLLFIILLVFQSCYSVRLVSTNGSPMSVPDHDETPNEAGDFYEDKMYTVVETVIPSSVFTDKTTIPTAKEKCPSGKLYSVEYKNTFGGSLLYLISFGTKRKVKITYVCMEEDGEMPPIN